MPATWSGLPVPAGAAASARRRGGGGAWPSERPRSAPTSRCVPLRVACRDREARRCCRRPRRSGRSSCRGRRRSSRSCCRSGRSAARRTRTRSGCATKCPSCRSGSSPPRPFRRSSAETCFRAWPTHGRSRSASRSAFFEPSAFSPSRGSGSCCRRPPSSARYVVLCAPPIPSQLCPFGLHRCQVYSNLVGLFVQVPAIAGQRLSLLRRSRDRRHDVFTGGDFAAGAAAA